jgi:hypothetical protein
MSTDTLRTHQPKGGMCRTCLWETRDCSALPFESMPVIERDGAVSIVRCAEHTKANKEQK